MNETPLTLLLKEGLPSFLRMQSHLTLSHSMHYTARGRMITLLLSYEPERKFLQIELPEHNVQPCIDDALSLSKFLLHKWSEQHGRIGLK